MQSHTLTVLGLEVSFKAEADPKRVEQACALLEERYSRLVQTGGHLSKEKLLTFLALGLAEDVVLLQGEQDAARAKIKEILVTIDTLAK